MSQYRQFRVQTDEGVDATMFATSRFLDDSDERLLRFPDGEEMLVPRKFLESQPDGSYRLTVPLKQLRSTGSSAQSRGPSQATDLDAEMVVPAIEERLEISKRKIETGRIRINKTVETSDSVIDEPLFQESYDVERVSINRILDEPAEPRYEGDTLVLPVMEEVLVVEKRLVLREEVRVTRTRQEVRDPQKHTIRREHLNVERLNPA